MIRNDVPLEQRILSYVQGVAQLGAIAAVPTIIWLSLIPGDMQTRTPLPKTGEHFLAYFLTAACMALALGPGRRRLLIAGGLTAFAGALEIGQAAVPGRTAGMGDFLASAAGAVVGVTLMSILVATLLRQISRRRQGHVAALTPGGTLRR